MDDKDDINDLNYSESLSECSLHLLLGRLNTLLIPDECAFSFKLYDKRVSFLLTASDTSVILKLCNLAITLTHPKILKSLVDYFLGSQID